MAVLKIIATSKAAPAYRKTGARGLKKVKCADCRHHYFMGPCRIFHEYHNPQMYRLCSAYLSQ